jgi:hypothetical protein
VGRGLDGAHYVRWPPPPPQHIRDVVALVLAGGAVLALIVTAVGASIHRGPISAEESSLLSTALGAAVGAVATYLGQGARDKTVEGEQPRESPDPP